VTPAGPRQPAAQTGTSAPGGSPAEEVGAKPAAEEPAAPTAEEEEERRRRRRWLLLLLLLLLLLCCLGGLLYYLFGYRDGNDTSTPATSTPTVGATTGAAPTTGPPATTAAPTSAPPTTAPAEPATIEMPNVVGKRASEADKVLRDLGFTSITFVSEDNPGEPVQLLTDWKVTTQSVPAGTKVAPDTDIELQVTKLGGGRG
jgi:pyruvate/2-oxoglutarate dehydrogenase complex dihydrolipoamide acyltransferase (E2) component